MQLRGLCGERGGEEIRSLQGLISEDEEGGDEDEGEVIVAGQYTTQFAKLFVKMEIKEKFSMALTI